jgi:hypothetical protein
MKPFFQFGREIRLAVVRPRVRVLQARGRQDDHLRESRTHLRIQLPHLQELHRLQGTVLVLRISENPEKFRKLDMLHVRTFNAIGF